MGGTSGIGSLLGAGVLCFFCTPKEKVRPARFKNPDPLDLGAARDETSWRFFFPVCFESSRSADDGAVEAALCLEEVSVDVALVVFDAPLPLERSQRHGARLFSYQKKTGMPREGRGGSVILATREDEYSPVAALEIRKHVVLNIQLELVAGSGNVAAGCSSHPRPSVE